MNSLGWAGPYFLAALAGVALPVLIHFLTRPRPRSIRFPAFRLLLEAGGGRQALNRLRAFIVLTLRTLAVAALVLLFARPYLQAGGQGGSPSSARRVAVILDTSLSMRTSESGVTLFTKARAQAADLLRSLEAGSEAAVILSGMRARSILPALSQNLAFLHEELIKAEAGMERADPAAALELGKKLLNDNGTIFVFSDFQRTNWGAAELSAPAGISLFLKPVTARPAGNIGLTALLKVPNEPVEGEPVELHCTAFNSSGSKRIESLAFEMEGISQSAQIELQPYASGSAIFTFSLPKAGIYAGKVTLKCGDALSEDNTRYLTVRVRQALQVLLLADADPADTASPGLYLNAALSPSPAAAAGVRVTRRRYQDADRGALETADVFVLTCPAHISGETAEIVSRRVTEGAQALVFLEGPSAPALANSLTGASQNMLAPPFLLLREISSTTTDGGHLARPAVSGGPLRIFDSDEQCDLTGISIHRHWLTDPIAARRGEVILAHSDGAAALALSPAGRGTALFANIPVAPAGGNLAGSPLFPVLVHELLRSLRQGGSAAENQPGLEFDLDIEPAKQSGPDQDAARTICAPSGQPVPFTVLSRGRTVKLHLPALAAPGHYPVTLHGQTEGIATVNAAPSETDTRLLDISSEAGNPGGARGAVSVIGSEGELISVGKPVLIWPWLLAAAVAFFAAEMTLLALWRRQPASAIRSKTEGGAA